VTTVYEILNSTGAEAGGAADAPVLRTGRL